MREGQSFKQKARVIPVVGNRAGQKHEWKLLGLLSILGFGGQ
jgi:hypothetical protein